MLFVVDASVAIKWVVPEVDSAQAIAIRRHELIAPELLFSECCNALWKSFRKNPAAASAASRGLEALMAVPLTVVPGQGLVRRILEIALGLDHPAYDSLYLALAELHRCQVITADARLLRKVAGTPYSHLVISLQNAATD